MTHSSVSFGAPCWIRTNGLSLIRGTLYQTELTAHILFFIGAIKNPVALWPTGSYLVGMLRRPLTSLRI